MKRENLILKSVMIAMLGLDIVMLINDHFDRRDYLPLLCVVVCFGCGYLASIAWSKKQREWFWPFCGIAITYYNPFMSPDPFLYGRDAFWLFMHILAIAVLVVSMIKKDFIVLRKRKVSDGGGDLKVEVSSLLTPSVSQKRAKTEVEQSHLDSQELRAEILSQDDVHATEANMLGRARRLEYFFVVLAALLGFFVLETLAELECKPVVLCILWVVLVAVLVIESIRRMHDCGISGWWALLLILPLTWPMTLAKGEKGLNKYGSDPRD